MFAFKSFVIVATLFASSYAIPAPDAGTKPFTLQNGKDAIALNDKFKSLTADSQCTDGDDACVGGKFGACTGGKFALTQCGAGTVCAALPLVNKAGTAVTCTTAADRDARIAATGASGAGAGADSAADVAAAPSAGDTAAPAAASPAASPAAPAPAAKGFQLKNGEDAIALNDKFTSLTADSTCTDGEDACIGGQFAQCTGGKFALTSCGAGTICAALPLVNKPGTSITCTTTADKNARIAATGASGADGGAAANGAANAAAPAADTAPAAASPAAAAPAEKGGFKLQNGKDAQAETAKDASLTPDSPCTAGQNACINEQFAQCSNGKFVLSPCGGGLKCFTLPLVNKSGTSNTCTTQADATQRIKNTGAA